MRRISYYIEKRIVKVLLQAEGYELKEMIHKANEPREGHRWELRDVENCFEVHVGYKDNIRSNPLETIITGLKGWTHIRRHKTLVLDSVANLLFEKTVSTVVTA